MIVSCTSTTDFSETVTITDILDEVEEEEDGEDDEEEEEEEEETIPDSEAALCEGGFAGIYPCENYDLMGHFSLSTFQAGAGNDCWGWTDPQTGKEYAIIGLDNGTAFVDISDPINPIFTGKLPILTSTSLWRDIKVYNNHAFIVSESSGHGLRVFNLAHLRDVVDIPEFFTADAVYSDFGSAHNITINEDTGYAYVVGSDTFGGGPHFVNIQSPLNPVNEGGFSASGYSHDAQVVIYDGPDADYTGQEIYIGSNENEIVIVDVTDKSSPQIISTIGYANTSYTHQNWFSQDKKYIIVGDETDELDFGFNTKTIVFDVTDLDNPQFHFDFSGATTAIDHNGYVKGNDFYLSNYRAGLQVFDISDIENSNATRTGFFDTYPLDDNASFDGAWSVYPYFASGNIIISDINLGLFIVKKQ